MSATERQRCSNGADPSTAGARGRSGPLAGVRVLELGSFIAGPFAGQLCADYGADVVKVEPPGRGDPMRAWGVTRDGKSLWWPTIARDKRSLTLDLRGAEGQALIRRMAPKVDVVIENFRPGTLERWGLGYEALRAINPGIIVVHVSGFGQSGPYAAQAGFGSVAEAVGGIRFTTGDPEHKPSRSGVSLGDSLAALFAVIGALAALAERARSGEGQEVDVAIYEAVFALMESSLADMELGGVVRQRSGSTLPGVAPSNAYPTADGSDVVIAGNADTVFSRLAAAMGRPELASDPRYATHGARGENAEELDELISAWTREQQSEALIALLNDAGVPAGRINSAREIVADPHFLARQMIVRKRTPEGWELPMSGVVPKFSRTPGQTDAVGPALGEHTDAVLRELAGVGDEELERLRTGGVV
jgi:formyl-CoA transferase/succinyl-CoA--D-citramalate CoA-transferase